MPDRRDLILSKYELLRANKNDDIWKRSSFQQTQSKQVLRLVALSNFFQSHAPSPLPLLSTSPHAVQTQEII